MLAKGWIDGRPVKLIWFRHEACLKGLHGKPVRQTGEWRLSCWTVASLQRRIHRRRRVDRGRRRRKHGAPTGAADAAGGDRRVRGHAGCGSPPHWKTGPTVRIGATQRAIANVHRALFRAHAVCKHLPVVATRVTCKPARCCCSRATANCIGTLEIRPHLCAKELMLP